MKGSNYPSGIVSLRAAWTIYFALLAFAALWLTMIVAAPYLLTNSRALPALWLYQCFSSICHQIPERSFHVSGFPLAVCSRCTGLYFGAFFGMLLYPLLRRINNHEWPHRRFLVLALLPTVIDLGGNALGLFTNTFASRTITALLAGMVAAFYIFPGLIAAFAQFFGTRRLDEKRI
jgi:uncharacterized membrane protein